MIPNNSPRAALRSDAPSQSVQQPRKRLLQRQSSQPGSNSSIAESLAFSNEQNDSAKPMLKRESSRLSKSSISLPLRPLNLSSVSNNNSRTSLLTPPYSGNGLTSPRLSNTTTVAERTVTDFTVKSPHSVPSHLCASIDEMAMSRSDLNKARAARLQDEESVLEQSMNSWSAPPPQRASRSALQKMRANRMHAEEAHLYDLDSRAAKHGKFPASVAVTVADPSFVVNETMSPVAEQTVTDSISFDFSSGSSNFNPEVEGFFGGPDRRTLQKRRAARMYEEERSLYIGDAKEDDSFVIPPNDGGDSYVGQDDSSNKFVFGSFDAPKMIPSRRALQQKRAARMHEEEASLYEHDAKRPIEYGNDKFAYRQCLQKMRADRVHQEEMELYSKDLAMQNEYTSTIPALPDFYIEGFVHGIKSTVEPVSMLQAIRAAKLASEESAFLLANNMANSNSLNLVA